MSLLRSALAVALMLGLGAVTSSACKPKTGEAAEKIASKEKEPGVDVVLSEEGLAAAHLKMTKVVSAPGTSQLKVVGTLDFVPSKVARVGPLMEGRITQVRVQPGEHVTARSLLATMDSPPVGRARADYLGALSRLALAESELKREKTLVEQGAGTPRDVERAEAGRQLAELESRAAGERLKTFGIDPGALAKLDPRMFAGSTGLSLSTPIAGEVLVVDARVGQSVHGAETLFVVGSVDTLWLVVSVYERDLARIAEGDPAHVSVLARPGRTFTGKVDHIYKVIDKDKRVADVRIALDNKEGQLGPGMSATALIAIGTSDAGAPAPRTLVPRGAIQAIDGQPFVFVEKGTGKFELRAIERGSDYDEGVDVTQGLAAGETVVVDGSFILKSEVLREQMGKND